jgi:putative tryptophan/tyrosine transport system substrate-binding protein
MILRRVLQSLQVRSSNPDFEQAFRDATKGRTSALVTIRSALLLRHAKQIAELAIKNRLPCMCEGRESVEAGGLMSYSADEAESFRRAAMYVDKILKGAKPADLPVEQPTKFELVINLKTAKALNITIPPLVLMRATKVIK